MVDWLVRKLFWWTSFREAVFAEVHMYDQLDEIMSDPESMNIGSSFYPDVDGWRGWSINNNTYYFNDIPEDTVIDAFNELNLMEIRSMQLEFEYDEMW